MTFVQIKILKCNLLFCKNGVFYRIYGVVDMLITVLGRIKLYNVLFENVRTVTAAESGYFVRQFFRLFRGYETCSLHCVYKNTKFGHVEISVQHIIAVAMLTFFTNHFVSVRVKSDNILIQSSAVTHNSACGKFVYI